MRPVSLKGPFALRRRREPPRLAVAQSALIKDWSGQVGKGDRKTRRGKIYAGYFGKTRPKDAGKKVAAKSAAAAPARKPAGRR